MTKRTQESDPASAWPSSKIFWMGMLGDAAGERYQRRCLIALAAEADELARRMHLEAMAYTYLTGMALCMALGGLGKPINPMLIILLDLIRAGFLYVIARRYS